jgi:tRNA (guanine-N7-)-methyltransferase
VPLDLYDALLDQRLTALRSDFFPTLPLTSVQSLTLELGCGHGHYLNAYAAAHPGEFCIGLDLIGDRIARAQRKATRARLANLAFVQAEASLFLAALAAPTTSTTAPVCLSRIFVLFSDPWPKRRHWKHRLMQTTLLDTLASLSSPGAALHFRTDHPEYFAYARELVLDHTDWLIAAPDDPRGNWPLEHVSVFEERALAGVPQSFTALRRSPTANSLGLPTGELFAS